MLKTWLKEIAGGFIRFSGLGAIARHFVHRRHMAILVYHDPDPVTFARHLAWLRKHYRLVSLDTLAEAIETGNRAVIPACAVAVTFDDGHRGNAALAGLFARYGLRPTIYLCSQIVNTRRHFWWTEAPQEAAALKALPQAEFLQRLEALAGYRPEREYETRQALNLAELEALRAQVDFGGHTRFHPVLTQCADALAREEVLQSRAELATLLQQPVAHFAYPNGDYGPRERLMIQEAGYRTARTIRPGWNDASADPHQLRAFSVEDDASLNVLALRLSGALIPALAFRRWLRRGTA